MRLGVHVSAAGRIYGAVERSHSLGCNTMQFFSRNPQQWRGEHYLETGDINEFIRRSRNYRIEPVFIHIPYLINLASPNPRLYEASIEAYIEDILEAHLLKADYIVTHMGSHKETSEEAGLKRLSQALNRIIKKTANTKVGILLENTSGSGSWLGYKFMHQRIVFDALADKKRLGLCFDTAHAYLAGYDISTKDGLEEVLEEIDKTVGLQYLKLIHLNDAKGPLGSKHDRHEHIGKGNIGLAGMRRIINHPRLRKLPFILETPREDEEANKIDLATVKRLRPKG
ncbi:MAG: deoxyribonuclease IV [Candidatus Omnitrophota bacterium]